MSKKKSKKKDKSKKKEKIEKKKKQPMGLDMWTFIIVPPKGKLILVSNGPYQDFPAQVGKPTKTKRTLIKRVKTMRTGFYSSLIIYNHEKKPVWNAGLPSTM